MTFLKHSIFSLVILVCLIGAGCESTTAPPSSSTSTAAKSEVKTAPPIPKVQPGEEIVVIETDFGKVKIQLFPDVAPKHVENFKKRISEGFYNGLAFHRAVPNLIVQGGDPNTKGNDRSKWGVADSTLEKLQAEFSDRAIVKGTVAAARNGYDPHSASTQFFICASAYPDWNGQYTNFGQVIEGMSQVQAMTKAPTDDRELLKNKVVMKKVYLEKYK